MATTTYSLKCGTCGYSNNVQATINIFKWTCTNDGSLNITSAPTNTTGIVITDALLANSIIAPALVAALTNIVQGISL